MYGLYDLLDKTEYKVLNSPDERVFVTGVITDSRCVLPGNVFICLKGGKNDGADYISEALKRGARAIICEKEYNIKTKNVVFVLVKDARSAYARIISNMNGNPSSRLKVIAVTGTNGKTTVTRMIYSALTGCGRRCAIIGTLGAEFEGKQTSLLTMTTPDPEILYALLKRYADDGAEYVVMEASSHALSLKKLDGIDFEIGAITNLTAEHLDFHGNMEKYYNAKLSLFQRCKKGVFLCDDFYTVKMKNEAECEKISCSVKDRNCDYYAEDIGFSFEKGTEFRLCGKAENCLKKSADKESIRINSPIPADFTASNALLAAVILKEAGIGDEDIQRGIASLENVEGRMEKVTDTGGFSVFIDFAHTPDALSKLLQSVKKIKKPEERIITLFGCGGDRDRSKRSLMGAVASRLSDFVIITEDNSRSEDPASIIDEIMTGFDKSCPHIRIDNREKAIEYAVTNAGRGDIILLCGKGHEKYEIGKEGIKPFSEKEIVKKTLLKLGKNSSEN